ncbi:FAD-binding PCMH-type domain-containing protein [Aphelenchoides fujianensis]|nr:FAD-binding PCMH-type domain-containing protein [Aphelenchoides fujianensis]
MTDLEAPLNEAERAEFALRSFVHFVVNQAGKFGDEAAAEVLDGGLRDPQWAHVERLMGGVRLEATIGDEIDRLGEFLEFFSYTRIIREYIAGANEQFAQRNLDQLIAYTVLSVQHLLQQGLQSNWTEFCEQAADFQLVQPSAQLPLTATILTWYTGQSKCVLTPESAEHVSAILRHCYARRLAVVPQSGNTGLVGGSVPVFDEIVLSMRKLNKHFKLHPSSGIVECDAGFVLHELDERLERDGYMMPLDLGARGSCFIGGNIATNAGGIRLIRYGSLHANVLALQVVIPDEHGTILELGSNLRKDNSDLKTYQLFIGSEGQLGVITRASVLVTPKPSSVALAFLGVDSFANCTAILRTAKQHLGEILGLAQDGMMAESGADSAYLWKLRENASLALNFDGYVYKHDLSLPLDHFYELTEVVRERLKGSRAKRVVTFGHVGDGNTHLNVTADKFDEEIFERLYPFIYEWVHEHGGSISAEHGIGRLKRPYHHTLVPPTTQRINAQIKRAFDPRGILSPYKMID